METPTEHQEVNNHFTWKLRFSVGVVMLFLALLGMIITNLEVNGSWSYWRIMTPVYALLSIGLSLYLRHHNQRPIVLTIWHEIVHWIGLILAIYLVSVLVDIGFISRFQAGIQVLLLLSLATFLAGIYFESTFIVVGIALGLLVAGIGFLEQYLYITIIPVIVIALLGIFFLSRHKKHKKNEHIEN